MIAMLTVDVLIVGSEGAGARAAAAAADAGADVLVLTKGPLGRSGATLTAEAGISVDGESAYRLFGLPQGRGDSMECFFEDTVRSGKFLNDQRLVQAMVEEIPFRLQELVALGMPLWDLFTVTGHRYARSCYSSGRAFVAALHKGLRSRSVPVLEHVMVTDLLVENGQVAGVLALDMTRGELVPLGAKAVVLATGGCMGVYPVRTAPQELTGDGHAMAWRAGASLVDMEFSQFMPCTLLEPERLRGNQFPMQMGPLSPERLNVHLLNRFGDRFMLRWDPERAERTTRDLLAIGIMTEIAAGRAATGGGVWMSFQHLPRNLVQDFARWAMKPNLHEDWRFEGIDFGSLMEGVLNGQALQVSVASHFFMGGLLIEPDGATTVPGLYAAGEAAGGLHGANRLGGNALAQVLVQGARAGTAAAHFARTAQAGAPAPATVAAARDRALEPLRAVDGPTPFEVNRAVQDLAWECAGVIRDGTQLARGVERLAEVRSLVASMQVRPKQAVYNPEWILALQVRNKLTVLEAIIRSAQQRAESRGAHYRSDHPGLGGGEWVRNLVVANRNGVMTVESRPPKVTSMLPPAAAAQPSIVPTS